MFKIKISERFMVTLIAVIVIGGAILTAVITRGQHITGY